jgi:hypothetical protein
MPISHPKQPNASQYEDCVAAALNACGYFVETRVRLENKSSQLLELDIVATPSGDTFINRELIEVKSGGWGFKDIFKIYGQMNFLGINRGCLVHIKPAEERDVASLREIETKTGIRCCNLPTELNEIYNYEFNKIAPACVTIPDKKIIGLIFEIGWYEQIAQRLGAHDLRMYCRGSDEDDSLQKIKKYWRASEQTFFKDTSAKRVLDLYQAYIQFPKLSGEIVEKLAK